MPACLGTTKEVKAIAVEQTAETVRIKNGDETVYAALRKGGSAWIVRYNPEFFSTEA